MVTNDSDGLPQPGPYQNAPRSRTVRLLLAWKIWTVALILALFGICASLTLPVLFRVRAIRYFESHPTEEFELTSLESSWEGRLNEWTSGGLQELESLRFAGATDETLRHVDALHEVRHLWLEEHAHLPITDRGLASLERLHQLEDLRLFGPGFTDAGLARILAARPPLKRVVLVDTGAGRETMVALSRIPSIERLLVIGDALRDDTFRELPIFPSLTYLDVDGLGDHGAAWVSRLPVLEYLKTLRAATTDAGFQDLCKSASLQGVYLYGAPISGDALQLVSELEHLRYLGLVDCPQLTAADIARLPADLDLEHMALSPELFDAASAARLRDFDQLRSLASIGRISDPQVRTTLAENWMLATEGVQPGTEDWTRLRVSCVSWGSRHALEQALFGPEE